MDYKNSKLFLRQRVVIVIFEYKVAGLTEKMRDCDFIFHALYMHDQKHELVLFGTMRSCSQVADGTEKRWYW